MTIDTKKGNLIYALNVYYNKHDFHFLVQQ